jgi:hypothetical protein
MKLYRIEGTIVPSKEYKVLQFVGTQKDARDLVRAMKNRKEFFADLSWEQEDVPTDKEGLLRWLNEWCPTVDKGDDHEDTDAEMADM